MAQETFNPVNYCFRWTDPKPGETFGWYEWDSKAAHSEALKARNARKRELAKRGIKARAWSNPGSLMSRGGIGSGKPHIELYATVYHLNY